MPEKIHYPNSPDAHADVHRTAVMALLSVSTIISTTALRVSPYTYKVEQYLFGPPVPHRICHQEIRDDVRTVLSAKNMKELAATGLLKTRQPQVRATLSLADYAKASSEIVAKYGDRSSVMGSITVPRGKIDSSEDYFKGMLRTLQSVGLTPQSFAAGEQNFMEPEIGRVTLETTGDIKVCNTIATSAD